MQRVVIKIGSSSLCEEHSLSHKRLALFATAIAAIHTRGIEVVIVCSGAIAAGRETISVEETVPQKQMLAAVGQVRLVQLWAELFEPFDITIGQVLLSRGDLEREESIEHAHNTFSHLLKNRVIPIVNENDTVATEEICFGDNDTLSALVADLIGAHLLILLTDQEGLYTKDPRHHSDAKLVEIVETIDERVADYARGSTHQGSLGTGGMATKLEAASFATKRGIATVIASGKEPSMIEDLINGKQQGTYFTPQSRKSKKKI